MTSQRMIRVSIPLAVFTRAAHDISLKHALDGSLRNAGIPSRVDGFSLLPADGQLTVENTGSVMRYTYIEPEEEL